MFNILVLESDARLRLALVSLLRGMKNMQVVGISSNPMMANMQLKHCRADLVLLTIDQEKEAVATFLTQLQEQSSIPVVMLSDKILPSTDAERLALRSGCATIMVKSSDDILQQTPAFAIKLEQHLIQSATAFQRKKLKSPASQSASVKDVSVQSAVVQKASGVPHRAALDTLIAIGASTGGTNALRQVVARFPANSHAVVIVQHIPKAFAQSFIDKLEKASPMRVVSACDGMIIHRGSIYVGAGDEHFTIEKLGNGFVCRVGNKDKVNGHCPSVDRLFDSVALCAGARAVGAIMTGMGEDGARGLKKMRENRARTVAQDKQSSVVWGMPGVAVKIGAAEEQVPLHQLAERLIQLAQ